MVIVRTLLRACSAAPLSKLVPTTSMKVLPFTGRHVTITATPAPLSVPAPAMWGPDVKVTCRPVSVIAKLASLNASACDLALVSEPTWITGALAMIVSFLCRTKIGCCADSIASIKLDRERICLRQLLRGPVTVAAAIRIPAGSHCRTATHV